jgi:hypothetical protein
MIQEYVNKLVENLPDDIKNNTTSIDLVLDGGSFNGSYLVGALIFLKEMEKRKYIKVNRISACSVGSIAAFLYFINNFDLITELYKIFYNDFKNTYKLGFIVDLKKYLIHHIPDDIFSKINNCLFICYHNMKKNKKIVKSKYKDKEDIINTIIKSCFLPYLIDGNLFFKNKFMDGMNPYIFKATEKNKKILYLDLFGYDKIGNVLNVKNEKSNYHRILSGLLDIHSFYIKQSPTQMCSYVHEWSYSHMLYNYSKVTLERITIMLINIIISFKYKLPENCKDFLLYKIISRVFYCIYVSTLEYYCL